MALKLRVISDHYKVLGKRSSRLFGVTGGRIGRARDNDWILPDPDRYVSSHHCRVSFRAGAWVLEDTSTNGVFVNGADTPVSIQGPRELRDGDRLRLGDYEILVSIDARNDFPPDASGQMPVPARVQAAARPDDDLGEELDLTDLLGDSLVTTPPAATPNPVAALDLAPFCAESSDTPAPFTNGPSTYATPRTAPSAAPLSAPVVDDVVAQAAPSLARAASGRGGYLSLLDGVPAPAGPRTTPQRAAERPDDWQMQTRPYDRRTMTALASPAALVQQNTRADTPAQARQGARREAHAHAPAPGELTAGVEAFCRGAGIDPSALSSDTQSALLALAGQMLREVVLGLMDSLKGRADLKSRLRLSQTTIQPGENNPLKFSASVDEAMLKLLDPHGSRYLGPIEAIRDSFADLRTHQSALAGAIQAAIDEIMSRIEPWDLQERFDRGLKRGALLGAANKLKYWDLYAEFYHVLNQRNEHGLPTLFAEELARSYAERAAKKK